MSAETVMPPRSRQGPPVTVGIDVGATLCKLALRREVWSTASYPSNDLGAVRALVEGWSPGRVVATGGGADRLGGDVAGVPIEHVSEFDAWARGAPLVAAEEGIGLPTRYLLVSLGTGTSVLSVGDRSVERVGGTALGGGTILGLGRLLLGVESFAELAAMAERGDRRTVDLLVGDIYRGADAPLLRDLTAASFGKLHSSRPEDLAHALMGLVGENVALLCGGFARGLAIEGVVYCGSTLAENPALRRIVAEITTLFGHRPCFLAGGAFCGAVGAAAA
jgi:type II pantothenate kinase